MSKHMGWMIVGVLVVAGLGCGRSNRLTRYAISGAVNHGGSPVPSGTIRMEPDSDAGNRGPATMLSITDGKYQSEAGFGVLGGKYIVEITGMEKMTKEQLEAFAKPKSLFAPYTAKIDLPKQDSVQDFEIPVK